MYDKFIDWEGCYYNFNAWVITIAVGSLLSAIFNLWQMRNLDLKWIWLKEAEETTQDLGQLRDNYEKYAVKRRLDKTTNIVFILSILVDTVMVAMSCYAIVIGIYASKDSSYCNYLDT